MWWHTVTHEGGGEVKGKLANGVGSHYPSHYLRTCCIQHYYSWCAHLGLPVVDWTDAPTDLNGLFRFAERRNLISARVPSHFNCPLRIVTTGLQKVNCSMQCSTDLRLFWGNTISILNAIPTRSSLLTVWVSQCLCVLMGLNAYQICEIWGSPNGVAEDSRHPGCDAVSLGGWLPTREMLNVTVSHPGCLDPRQTYLSVYSLMEFSQRGHARCGCNVEPKRRWCHVDQVPNLGSPKWGQVKGAVNSGYNEMLHSARVTSRGRCSSVQSASAIFTVLLAGHAWKM